MHACPAPGPCHGPPTATQCNLLWSCPAAGERGAPFALRGFRKAATACPALGATPMQQK